MPFLSDRFENHDEAAVSFWQEIGYASTDVTTWQVLVLAIFWAIAALRSLYQTGFAYLNLRRETGHLSYKQQGNLTSDPPPQWCR